MKRYVVKLAMRDALELGIVHCECGHPPNNHFIGQGKAKCARCKCQELRPKFSRGKAMTTVKVILKAILNYDWKPWNG